MKVWDLEGGDLLHTLSGHEGRVYGALLLRESQRALSWSADHTLKLWDLRCGELLQTFAAHQGRVHQALALGDQTVLSLSSDRTLRLWDLGKNTLLGTYHADATINAVAFSQSQQRIFAGDAMGRIHLLKLNYPP